MEHLLIVTRVDRPPAHVKIPKIIYIDPGQHELTHQDGKLICVRYFLNGYDDFFYEFSIENNRLHGKGLIYFRDSMGKRFLCKEKNYVQGKRRGKKSFTILTEERTSHHLS